MAIISLSSDVYYSRLAASLARNNLVGIISQFIGLISKPYIVVAFLAVIYYLRKEFKYFIIFLSSFLSSFTALVIKYIIKRPRPLFFENSVAGYSLPSVHATMIFSLAVVVSEYFPEYRLRIYSAAIIVAVSRVLIGVHFITDVLVGASLGIIIGIVILRYKKFSLRIHNLFREHFL